MNIRIVGGRVLLGGGLEDAAVDISIMDGIVAKIGSEQCESCTFDARGLIVLPGIVDIHGDAFERQIMPRPGVAVSLDIALIESDRQAISNGITTVFHGVTWSWEPGLRGAENARGLLAAMEALRPRLAADTRFHLRHETYNLDAEVEVADWLARGRIDAVAFNNHLPSAENATKRPDKIGQMAERSGLPREDFLKLVERLRARRGEVPLSIARIADHAQTHKVALLSHDDESPQQRRWFRNFGCRISEFPMNVETAREAMAGSDDVVLGAPNVMRGGSHLGWVNASDMIAHGLCSILASDYYYPAPLIAAFRLAHAGVVPLDRAWSLISGSPASAVGLSDRGCIAHGMRADLVLVDATLPSRPQVVAALVAGRVVHLTQAERILG
jgi:alpha-D-ribose 1-methylphosphonate 5-triphosphate diphosphatase